MSKRIKGNQVKKRIRHKAVINKADYQENACLQEKRGTKYEENINKRRHGDEHN